jgi:hypothetical protein
MRFVRTQRICTLLGKDFRGYPKTVAVEASSVYEAAVRAMDELRKDGGPVSELQVTIHEPGRSWKVQPQQLARWVASYTGKDNVGLRDAKRRVHDFLVEQLRR